MSETKDTKQPTEPQQAKESPLIATVKTLQFAWFVGHTVTLISILFYALTYLRIGAGCYKFWYQLALVGVLESFGVLIFQLVQKKTLYVTVLKDDNTQYLLLGLLLLVLRPYVLVLLLPFALFSLFHVLAYVKGYLLPLFGLENHAVARQIGDFVSKNNTKSIQLASVLEIYALLWLLLRVLTFRKRSLFAFLAYSVFIKLRYEKSIFTRNYVKSLEVQVDSLVNQGAATVPAVKNVWLTVKSALRKAGAITLVNDYSKEA